MILKKLNILSILFLSVISVNAQFVTDERVLSFEDNNSLTGVKAKNGSISLSEKHYKDGNSSLKWTVKGADDYLSINKDLKFELKDPTGKDLYLSTFVCWIYNENPMQEEVKFEFLKDGKYCCSFPMQMNFKGWRAAWVCYERDMDGTPEEGMNEIRVKAPQQSGPLYFDLLMTSSKTDHRHQTADNQLPFVNKGNDNHWLVVYKHSLIQPDLEQKPVTQQDITEIREIEKRFKSVIYTPSKLSEKQFENLKEKYNFYNIKYDSENNVSGLPIFFGRAAEAYERIIPEWKNGMMYTLGYEIKPYFDLMRNIANAYNNTTDETMRKDLEKMFLSMYDHACDQGFNYGSCTGNFTHYGYSFRNYYLAYFLMKDVLEANNRIDEASSAMLWFAITNEIFMPITIQGIDIDSFNTQTTGRIASILMMKDSPEKVMYLRAFSRWINNGSLPAPGLMGSFKTDGSCFHHCNNYPAYAVGGLDGATNMIYLLSNTSFAVSEEAHNTVKNVLMSMRFYCNTEYFPLAMSGRHPDGKGRLVPIHFANLALAGSPDRKEAIDSDLAQAYLRLAEAKAGTNAGPEYVPTVNSSREKAVLKTIKKAGFKAETSPVGNLSLGYSCVNVQRRDNWSLVARGHSRYLWAAEHYLGCNLFGRYLAHGSLQLMNATDGKNVTPKSSGWQEAGFNWARIPGTTAISLPVEKLHANILNVDAFSGIEEMLYSDQHFAGSLSQEGKNGNFGMILHEHDKYNGSHRARKSYHFFDDVAVALGSGIENINKDYNTETTVFQTLIADKNEFEYWNKLKESGARNILDPINTGYYIPKEMQNKISFAVTLNQQSLNEETAKPTVGDWSTMVINHGKAPKNESYEYAIIPNCNADRLNKFAKKPTYQVLQNDNNAHVVKDLKSGDCSFVVFEGKTKLPGNIVLEADTACLIMTKQSKNTLTLSVANPDLALYRGESDELFCDNGLRTERSIYSRPWKSNKSMEVPVEVTIKGDWNLENTPDAKIISNNKKNTVIRITCCEGKSYNFTLSKK